MKNLFNEPVGRFDGAGNRGSRANQVWRDMKVRTARPRACESELARRLI